MPRGSRAHNASMVLLRFGTGIVFLWFGVAQIRDPSFGMAYLPEVVYTIGNAINLANFDRIFVVAHGVFELGLAAALIVGFFTRLAALLLAAQLFLIVVIVYILAGPEMAVRDFCVLVATLSIAINGPDRMAADNWGNRRS